MSNASTATFLVASLQIAVPTAATGTAGFRFHEAVPVRVDASPGPATRLITPSPSAATSRDVRESLERLVQEWEDETLFISDLAARQEHPAYQRVIEIGWPAVPFLLARLRDRPDFWFHALRAVTGANPVSAKNAGRLVAMANEWIAWGRSNGVSV